MGVGRRSDKKRREGGFVVDRLILSLSAMCLALCSVCVCVTVRACERMCASRVIQENSLLTIRSASILTFLHFLSLKTQPQAQ